MRPGAAAAKDPGWQREEQPERAIARILDAADRTFASQGVASVGMAAIAEAAGCSRGTLYRYFPNRQALHVAYVNRAARAVIDRVKASLAEVRDPRTRLVEGIIASVAEVRAHPGTAAWFAPSAQASAARMSHAAEVVGHLTRRFVAELLGGQPEDPASRLRARWLVRVIVSLLANPGEDAAEERALVEQFVVAPLLAR